MLTIDLFALRGAFQQEYKQFPVSVHRSEGRKHSSRNLVIDVLTDRLFNKRLSTSQIIYNQIRWDHDCKWRVNTLLERSSRGLFQGNLSIMYFFNMCEMIVCIYLFVVYFTTVLQFRLYTVELKGDKQMN
jgi:hypothetical protein